MFYCIYIFLIFFFRRTCNKIAIFNIEDKFQLFDNKLYDWNDVWSKDLVENLEYLECTTGIQLYLV